MDETERAEAISKKLLMDPKIIDPLVAACAKESIDKVMQSPRSVTLEAYMRQFNAHIKKLGFDPREKAKNMTTIRVPLPAPKFRSPRDAESYTPVHMSEIMQMHSVKKRVLVAKTIAPPFVLDGNIWSVAEDLLGRVSCITLPMPFRQLGDARVSFDVLACDWVPEGTNIAIFEPRYGAIKGVEGNTICAEWYQQIEILGDREFKTWNGWIKNAHKLRTTQRHLESYACYAAALHGYHVEHPECCQILENVSIAYSKLSRYYESYLYGSVAQTLNYRSFKGPYRCALALESLGWDFYAWHYAEKAHDNGAGKAAEDLKRKLLGPFLTCEMNQIQLGEVMARILGRVEVAPVSQIENVSDSDLKRRADGHFVTQEFEKAITYYRWILKNKYTDVMNIFMERCEQMQRIVDRGYEKELYRYLALAESVYALAFDPHHKAAHLKRQKILKGAKLLDQLKIASRNSRMLTGDASSFQFDQQPIKSQYTTDKQFQESLKRKFEVPQTKKDVVNFYDEFLKWTKRPASLNFKRCQTIVAECYEKTKFSYRDSALDKLTITDPSPEELEDRLGIVNSSTKSWFMTGMEEFNPNPAYSPYPHDLHRSFGNSPWLKFNFEHNSTHVAIGFVDLGMFLAAKFTGDAGKGPVRWIGYDQSAYVVAKTLVILEMFKQSAPDDDVFQVWFSSAWSRSTACSFQKATSSLTDRAPNPSSDVHSILELWHTTTVSLQESRSKWLKTRVNKSLECVGCLSDKGDRMEMLNYFLTGQLGDAEVGSTVMFAIPESIGKLFPDEYFIRCIPISDLLLLRTLRKSFIETAIVFLTRQVKDVGQRIRDKDVVIELNHQRVSPQLLPVLLQIKFLRPRTVTWNNLCDYVSHSDFFRMTQLVSAEDTVHCFESVYWTREMLNTSIWDFSVAKRDPIMLKAEYEIANCFSEAYAKHFSFGRGGTAEGCVEWWLAGLKCKEWLVHFFKPANLEDFNKQTKIIDMKVGYNPFLAKHSKRVFMFSHHGEFKPVVEPSLAWCSPVIQPKSANHSQR